MKIGQLLTMVLIGCLLASACSSGTAEKPMAGSAVETTEVEKTADADMAENIDESNTSGQTEPESEEGATSTMGHDFGEFPSVNITGIDLTSLSDEELAVLYVQAKYCQAMTDADIEVMRELVSEDKTFTHMSGLQQTREEYFADVADGSLNYFTIGIADPLIMVDGDMAQLTYTSVLNANAYGARGTFRMKGTHHYERQNGAWIVVNP
jgi:hypothetical protein